MGKRKNTFFEFGPEEYNMYMLTHNFSKLVFKTEYIE